jgi:hypothetical protein
VVAAGLDRIRRIQRELTADHKEAEFVNEMELRQIQNGAAVFAPSLTMMVISSIAAILEEKQRKCCDGEEEDDLPLTKVAARITMPSVTLVEIALYISRTWGSVYVEPSSVQTAWYVHIEIADEYLYSWNCFNQNSDLSTLYENKNIGVTKCMN